MKYNMTTPGGKNTSTPSHKGPITLCLVCYNKLDYNMPRHVMKFCKRRDMGATAEARKDLGTSNTLAFRNACKDMGPSLFFSMTELEKRESYSPFEVAELLRSFGHCAVPEEFEDIYVRQPVYNHLTSRNFKREVEKEDNRRQEARTSRRLQGRWTFKAISGSEEFHSESGSAISEEETEPEDKPSVLRNRTHLKRRKRTVSSDEVEDESDWLYVGRERVHLTDTESEENDAGINVLPSGKRKQPQLVKSKVKRRKTIRKSEAVEDNPRKTNGGTVNITANKPLNFPDMDTSQEDGDNKIDDIKKDCIYPNGIKEQRLIENSEAVESVSKFNIYLGLVCETSKKGSN